MSSRYWLLLRKLDEQNSLFFTLRVDIQEDAPAVFTANVAGLENRMLAAGRSIDEAERNAIDMFQVLVDHSIDSDTPLSFELGNVPFYTVPVTLEKGSEYFTDFFAALMDAVKTLEEEWRSVPTSLLVASTSTLAAHQS